jgi:hypothetical protein
MLSQIVRPLVQPQIRLLAKSQTARSDLIEIIICWLGYLGVRAQVQHLETCSEQIKITLTVGQPDSCKRGDWRKILDNLAQSSSHSQSKLSANKVLIGKQQ